ncbi:MAG: S41 family peptidase [Candidatus Fimivivens sp.]|nr:S41 family peptidase [Candidatus Fimivivens sp.]
MNRKITLGGAVTLAIMFSTVTFIMTMIYAQKTFDSRVFNIKERETMYAKLAEVDRLVRQKYFNAIDEDTLGENLVRGYIAGIEDKYGIYLTAEQYAETQSNYNGRMVDIGIVCSPDPGGYILIDKVYTDSPAALSELSKGDLIIKVDDLAVTAESYEAAVDALKGEPGTTVTVLVRRGSIENSYTITRRKVEVPTAEGHIIGNIGYIRISQFNDNTPDQFFKVMSQLMEDGAQALVFDVRGNPGGTIESVGKILDKLLPEGPIISATYRNSTTPQVLITSDAEEIKLPMAVLINSKSASAAELFAQALKDYNKAKAIGVTTYGKGSMQEIHKLSDGSALDFTVARYNPPKSPNFEGIGVKPDYEVKLSPDLEKELENLDETSDSQLKKAIEVVTAIIKDQAAPGTDANAGSSESVSSGSDTEYVYTGEDDDEGEDESSESSSVSSKGGSTSKDQKAK